MKKLSFFTLALGLLLLTPYWSQAQFTTIDFNTGLTNNQGLGKSYAREGFTFAVNLSVANERQIVARSGLGFEGSLTLFDNNVTIGDLTRWTITKNDGAGFQFRSIYLQRGDPSSSASGTIQGFKNGSPVGSAKAISFNSATAGLKDYADDADFYDVDEIRIEADDINFYLDHFTYGPPFSVGDDDPAEVLNIAMVGSPTSTETEVSYTVTFSKGAFNVDITDFELTTTGSVTANLASVTGADGSTSYTAVVNNIAGEGSLRLDLKADTDIENEDGVDGTAAFTGGQVHYVGSCFTETFDQGETNGATTFSGNGKTFTLTGNWTVNTESPNNGLGGSAYNLKNNGAGPYTINLDDGVIAVPGLFLYLSSIADGSNPTADGSVAIRGLRSGSEVYAFAKTTGFATNFDTNSGYMYIDFSAESGDHSAALIDQLEISISGAFTYLNLDNFSWCLDFSPPSGYTVTIDQDPITHTNETSVSFTFAGAEIGTTYDYTFTSDEGGTPVLGSGTIATETDQVTGIDLSGLNAGTVTLSVTLTDASGNVGGAVTDEVEKIDNNAPVATAPAAPEVYEDDMAVELSDDFGVADAEGDDQTLTFTITGGILTLGTDGITFGGGGNGSASFTASGTLVAINAALQVATFTPTPDLFGPDAGGISFTANDGISTSAVAAVTFEIIGVNDDPTFVGLPASITVVEDAVNAHLSNALSDGTFDDVDAGDNNVTLILNVSEGTLAFANPGGIISISGNGTGTAVLTGTVANIESYISINTNVGYTPPPNLNGIAAAILTVSANDGGHTGIGGGETVVLGQIQIDITPVNDPPIVANPIPDQSATQDVAFSFQFAEDTFEDVDGDVLSYTAQLAGGGALPAWLSFDPATRTFSGTPTNWDVGTVSVEVIADDGNGERVSDFFDIVVANVNDAPTVVNPIPDQDAIQDIAFSFQFAEDTFEDIDGDVLNYTAQLAGGGALPDWLSFDPATRMFSGTPTNWDVGTVSVELIAEDGNGGSVSDFFDIVVANVNDIPVLTTSLGTTLFVEVLGDTPEPVVIDGGITVEDIDNPTLASATVSITTGHQPTEDILAFTNDGSTMGNISGSYDAGVLTLTSTGATATLAQWQAALRAVTYSNTSKAPNTANRTITFVVNDGEDDSNPVTKAISITDVNDPPTIDAQPSIEVVENVATALTEISFDDVDAGSADVEVTFSIPEGSGALLAGITADVTVTITGSHMVALEGTLADVNSYITNGELRFINTPDDLDDVSLDVVINDKGNTGEGGPKSADQTITITVRSIVPRVTQVYSPDPDGHYGLGNSITIHVEFDREVIATEVGDGIRLLLATGVPGRSASYTSGSGEETLIFQYSVQPGDENVDLDYLDTDALELTSGSTIESLEAGVGADLTLPTPGAVESLSGSNEFVVDGIAPTALAKDIILELDANGVATLLPEDLNDGSSDNLTLEGDLVFTASQTDFDCSDVGEVEVTLTVTDEAGNEATETATVTVTDNIPPALEIPESINLVLDTNGQVTLTAEEVDNGTIDACGIATLTISQTSFDCGDVGANTVTFTAIDVNGNVSTDDLIVKVSDNTAPTALAQNITVELNAAGTVSITPEQVDNGSTDVCGIADLALSQTEFTCENVGENEVTLTVTDVNGNVSTITATVTVEDNNVPTVVTRNITVQLDAGGAATVTPEQINDGSAATCGIASVTLDQTGFDCTHMGANEIVLTVTDVNGNINTGTATITIVDNIPPAVLTRDITVQLNDDGTATIVAEDIDNGSTDNCGISSLSIDKESFVCDDLGEQIVTLTAVDASGNENTATATVTIVDNIPPALEIPESINLVLDTNGQVTLTAEEVDNGTIDACGIATLTISQTSFDCGDVGANIVTFTAIDVNGNVSTDDFIVNVSDNTAPTASAQNITVELDAAGTVSITPEQVDNGSTDACGIADLALSQTVFTCEDVGDNEVTLTVTDNNGNVSTATATVTVENNNIPTVVTRDIVIQLEANGAATVNPDQINDGSAATCGIASVTLDQTEFDCAHIGVNEVVLTVTDVNGNVNTGTATVIVVDNTPPVVLTRDITVQLDADGTATIVAEDIDNGSADNCGIASLSIDRGSFTCDDLGHQSVTLTVTDVNGNENTATATVMVEDTTVPVARTLDITVQLNADGEVEISATDIDNGSTDNCNVASLSSNRNSFDCSDLGDNTVILTVTDGSGNESTATAIVRVIDELSPSITNIPSDQEVMVNADGVFILPDYTQEIIATDNCGIVTLGQIPDAGTVLSGTNGTYTITLAAEDLSGNRSEAGFEIRLIGNIVERIISPDILTVPWNTQLSAINIPDMVEVEFVSGGSRDLFVNWTTSGYNPLEAGLYQFDGSLTVEGDIVNPAGLQPQLSILVEDKALPTDILLSNNTFAADIDRTTPIGSLSTVDEADDIHEYRFLGGGTDNVYFAISSGQLYWNTTEALPGRTTFEITVTSTDRVGNIISKNFSLNRERTGLDQITVTNTFTPNGDGVNDTWGVSDLRYYSGSKVMVFERSGERVFYTEDPDMRWDGTYEGKELSVGTYYWVLESRETGEVRRGILNLLRY